MLSDGVCTGMTAVTSRTDPRPTRSSLPAPTPRVAHRRLPTQALGEATLVWACLDCGSLGPLGSLPVRCPDAACRGEVALVLED
jgi:hypothetical protein